MTLKTYEQENLKFESFKDEGIEPELEIKMDKVFGRCAQGADIYVPFSSPYNVHYGQSAGYEEVGFNVGNDEWDTMWRESNPTSPNLAETLDMKDKGKRKKVMKSDIFENNKSAKTERTKPKGGSVALVERIDSMA
ncbi:uncharacterized protein LOC130824201 isoform X2 [Amaranthus tricolor]|uniref:uncharacterized protein LOC130824201 isoform X2 n=1 Tax=Amaranthus tricolor TaxID=29722 RepID=UPI00258E0D32|nr:uncharacterized protein LOC130824201 isoform X2 [Amaranthus tricolor]